MIEPPAADAAFDQISRVELVSPVLGRAWMPAGWAHGRGTFGGLVTAVAIRALELATPGRALRSLTAEICGPVQPGEVELDVEPLRVGSAVTTAALRLRQGGAVLAHAVGVLGLPRPATRDLVAIAAPTMPPWREVAQLHVAPPIGSAFGRYFDVRPTGPLPFMAGAVAASEGWIRPRNPGPRCDAAYLAACVDAYWPAILALEPAPRPTATIAFTFQPLLGADDADVDLEAPLYHRARTLASDAGYSVEQRELWSPTGRLLALNQQTFVVIK